MVAGWAWKKKQTITLLDMGFNMKQFTPVDSVFNRFSGGGSGGKLPPAPAPAPTPESVSQEGLAKGEAERKRLASMRGRRSTILSDPAIESQRASVLGDTV